MMDTLTLARMLIQVGMDAAHADEIATVHGTRWLAIVAAMALVFGMAACSAEPRAAADT